MRFAASRPPRLGMGPRMRPSRVSRSLIRLAAALPLLLLVAACAAKSDSGGGAPPVPLAKVSQDLGPASQIQPLLAFDDAGDGLAVWRVAPTQRVLLNQYRVLYAFYDGASGVWTPEREFDPAGYGTYDTLVGGRDSFLFFRRDGDVSTAWVLRAGVWGAPVVLDATPESQGGRIQVLGDGFTVWTANPDGGFLHTYDGTGWTTLAAAYPETRYAGIALDDGRPLAVSIDTPYPGPGFRITASVGPRDSAATAVLADAPDRVMTSAYWERCGTGGAVVVWGDLAYADTAWRMWARRFDGAAWSSPILLEEHTGSLDEQLSLAYPAVSSNADGCVVIWNMYGATTEIHAGAFVADTWQGAHLVHTCESGFCASWTRLASNAAGHVLVYSDASATPDGWVYRLHATRFQGTWQPEEVLSAALHKPLTSNPTQYIAAALDAERIGVAWMNADGTSRASIFDGAHWGPATIMGDLHWPVQVAGGGGRLGVVGTSSGIDDQVLARVYQGTEWGPQTELLRGTYPSSDASPQLVANPSAGVLAVWSHWNGGPYASFARGGAWTAPEPLAGPEALSLETATDGRDFLATYLENGEVLGVAGSYVGYAQRIVARIWSAGAWQDPADLTGFVAMRSDNGYELAGGQGRFAVAWAQPDGLFVRVRDASAWSDTATLSTATNAYLGPLVAGPGGFAVTWLEGSATSQLHVGVHDGSAWHVTEVTSTVYGWDMAPDEDGYLLAWTEPNPSGDCRLLARREAAGTWFPQESVADGAVCLPAPVVRHTPDGDAIFWRQSAATGGDVVASRVTGGTWTDPEVLASGGIYLDLVVDGSEGPAVVLYDSGINSQVLRVYRDGAWSDPVRLDQALAATDAAITGLVALPDGFAALVYARGDDGITRPYGWRYADGRGWLDPVLLDPADSPAGTAPALVASDGNAVAAWTRADPDGDPDVTRVWMAGF